MTALKVAIAVLGLWWVLGQISWHDTAVIAKGQTVRQAVFLRPTRVPVISRTSRTVTLNFARQIIQVKLPSGKIVTAEANDYPILFPRELTLPLSYLAKADGHPEIEAGLHSLMMRANGWLLLGALIIVGIPFFLTAWRWQMLMSVQDMRLSYAQCLRLNFVGQFYSTFLPGTTSGDLVKIIYTARVTGKTTQSAVTVLLDRVIGLIGLVMVAGIAAAVQLLATSSQSGGAHGPTTGAGPDPVLLHVVLLTGSLLAATLVGGIAYFSARLRRLLGIDAILNRLPLPEFIKHADRSLLAYRNRLGLIAGTFGISLVSQSVLPLAGFLAGRAFGMHAPFGCFMAYIPLAALAASLPIMPPQGIGVTEAILLHFFVTRGVDTASQSFALAQAIRFLPIAWNLLGAYWVVRGKFHRPTPTELEIIESELPVQPAAP
ncbi:MAG: flippase-like domain-containing protein [Phycisphaerae bacterium]|nr:flippase-like domain-containing protein [Phycisphaerae bacterium]